MKDLDFDELDKAVNSLMTGTGAAKQPPQGGADDDGEKTLDITPTLTGDAAPSFADLDKAVAKTTGISVESSDPVPAPVVTPPAPSSTPSPAVDTVSQSTAPVPDAQAPLAARRGGRFMDVVHPSSDMKKTVIPARPVSREGVMVGRTSAAPTDSSSETPADTEPKVESPAATDTPAAESATASNSEWPDPLEMADFKTPAAPQMTNDNLAADLLAEADKVEQEEKADGSTSPLTSPFLSGAKVEKRPLGSGAPTYVDDSSSVSEKEDKTVDNPDAQLPASPSETPMQLPEELQGDLMAIEADTHMGVPKTDESHPVAPAEALPEEESAPVVAEKETKEKTPEPTPERAVPTGPVSIPQQYREEPSTTDQKAGTIYDTDSYHKPLAHPAKKKPGWTWVIAIIVILIVGAGGGAALYFLGIV